MCVLVFSSMVAMIIAESKVNSVCKGGMSMQRYDEVLGTPFQIGNLTIKNRFCMAPIGGG